MKYNITVTRIGYREKVISVEAPDIHAAKNLAIEQAPDLEFPSEHDYEYAATGAIQGVAA